MLKGLTNIFILLLLAILSLCTQGFFWQKHYADQTSYPRVGVLIKKRIIEAGYPPKIILREELIHASSMLEDFYKKRDFQPAWIGSEGPLTQVDHLINAIEEADLEGLTPDYYHLTSIKTLLREVRETRKKKTLLISEIMADLDLLLTDAFLLLGCHFSAGCVNPTTVETKWFAKQGEVDVASVFEEALRENSIKESLKNLKN